MNKYNSTEKTTSSKWISAYLYYASPLDRFVIGGVAPFVKKLDQKPEVAGFFFIRYFENGSHIRLRILLKSKKYEDAMKLKVRNYFSRYFKKNPSQRGEVELFKIQKFARVKTENNSVCFVAYEPEIERYCGEKCIHIAEKHFELSSRTVLKVFDRQEKPDVLSIAIQLHLAFGFAMKLSTSEMKWLFSSIFESWLPLAYKNKFEQSEISSDKENEKQARNHFKKLYNAQKHILIPFHQNFLAALIANVTFQEDWLNNWINQNRLIHIQLLKTIKKGEYQVPEWLNLEQPREIPTKTKKLFYLYKSLIHMTNNRLGLANEDEGYIAYLISHSLDTILSE